MIIIMMGGPSCWRMHPCCAGAFVSSVDVDVTPQSKTGCAEPSSVGALECCCRLIEEAAPWRCSQAAVRRWRLSILEGRQSSVCQCAPVWPTQHSRFKLGWFDAAYTISGFPSECPWIACAVDPGYTYCRIPAPRRVIYEACSLPPSWSHNMAWSIASWWSWWCLIIAQSLHAIVAKLSALGSWAV